MPRGNIAQFLRIRRNILLNARSIFKKVQAGSMKPLHYFFRELLFAADASRAILSELRRNSLMIQHIHENSNRSVLYRQFEANSLAGIEQQCLTLLIFKWGFAFCCDTLLFDLCMTSCFGWSVSKQREWQRAFSVTTWYRSKITQCFFIHKVGNTFSFLAYVIREFCAGSFPVR